MTLRTKGKIWKYPGFGGWHFLTVTRAASGRIKNLAQGGRRGFGSVRVKARIGKSEWGTSVFPTREGMYLLPVKADVRKKEEIESGDVVSVELTLFVH